MTYRGATALAGGLEHVRATFLHWRYRVARQCWLADYFREGCSALAGRRLPGYKCNSGRLIPGCSHYAPQVQCTSRVDDAGVPR
jgi:hypothetical protein